MFSFVCSESVCETVTQIVVEFWRSLEIWNYQIVGADCNGGMGSIVLEFDFGLAMRLGGALKMISRGPT